MVYYVANIDKPALALLIYGKGEQADISPRQRDALLTLIAAEKTERRSVEKG